MNPEIGTPDEPKSHLSLAILSRFLRPFLVAGLAQYLRPIFALSLQAFDLIAGLNDEETRTLAPNTNPHGRRKPFASLRS